MLLENLAVLDFQNFDLKTLVVDSPALKQNPLGDPSVRRCPVLTPKGPAQNFPVVFMLSGFTGNGTQSFNVKTFEVSAAQRLDEALGRGEAPRAIFVFVDAMTTWGGSQFIDSDGMGRYESYLVNDLYGAVADEFGVNQACVMGGSSGGYGALWLASKHPDKFEVAIALAPDSFFEASLLPELRTALPIIKRMGGTKAVREELMNGKLMKRKDWHTILNVVAMGLCYAPLQNGEPVWPIEMDSGLVIEKIWAEWVKFDPLQFLPGRKLKTVYLDAGDRDQFQLQYGTRQIRDVLRKSGTDVTYVGFDGTHFDLGERRGPAWRWLATHWRV